MLKLLKQSHRPTTHLAENLCKHRLTKCLISRQAYINGFWKLTNWVRNVRSLGEGAMLRKTEHKFETELELDRPTSRMICIYHALSHPVRLTICKYLLARPYTVTEICELIGLQQYAVSQQLAVLRNSDVVETARQSRNVIYSLRSEAVRRILRVSLRNAKLEEVPNNAEKSKRASDFAPVK